MEKNTDLVNLFNKALALHQRGALAEAQSIYKKILKKSPAQPDVLHLLGVIEAQNRRYGAALRFFRHALALAPNNAVAHSNLGNVLRDLKQLEQAVASFDRALAIAPDNVDASVNRGYVQIELRCPEAALASFDRALECIPDHASAHMGRGIALCELKHFEEALASYDRALAAAPQYAEAFYNRGKALREVKRNRDSVASYDRALAIKPDYVDALYNRGNALLDLKQHEDAIASFDRLLAIDTSHADALVNRGNAFYNIWRYEEAVASYSGALAIRPNFADALYKRGVALIPLQRYEEAAANLGQLLQIRADYDYARGEFLHAKMHCCDWDNFYPEVARCEADVRAGRRSITPFAFQAICQSPEDSLLCSTIYVNDKYPATEKPLCQSGGHANEKIRLGYVSGEFRSHATSHLLVGLLEHHDKSRFQLYAFDNGYGDSSPVRQRIEQSVDRIINIAGMTDLDAAKLISSEKIDILVDLNGHFGFGRTGIFSFKPSPIQVNYLGFPATLGAGYYDYIIADRHVIHEDEEPYYVEKIAYLPDCYQANDSKRRIAELTVTRQNTGLPETGFVFCCFNNTYKITPALFEIWMRLLRRVEGSVLWLLQANDTVAKNLRREAEKHGIAKERLVFAARAKPEEHLARHQLADLFLDTLPYNAHTTASDALWSGLPLVTCPGATFPGRVAASLLHALGLSELIVGTLEDYEALAFKCATETDFLEEIRAKLARNRSRFPLFDTGRFCGQIETAFTTMWKRFQHGESPLGFTVGA